MHWSCLDFLELFPLQIHIDITNIAMGYRRSWKLLLHWLHGIRFEDTLIMCHWNWFVLINRSSYEKTILIRWQSESWLHHTCLHHTHLEFIIHGGS